MCRGGGGGCQVVFVRAMCYTCVYARGVTLRSVVY